jgi:SAM-dependent methyltransferase
MEGSSRRLYDDPQYYEIAFSFRDISADVSLFEECFRRFSRVPVRSVLGLGCGNCPHMEELARRGYQYSGLDISEAMLDYSRGKPWRIGAKIKLIHADMNDFSLESKFDFVFVLLGSLSVKSTAELPRHFDCVAKVLKRGGLYLLDWCVQFDPPWASEGGGTWEMEREGIKVKSTVSWKLLDRVEQTFEEIIAQEVDGHGNRFSIVGKEVKRAIFPQEFLCFTQSLKHFEFVGWWNNWNLNQPLEQAEKVDRPIVLIRRI